MIEYISLEKIEEVTAFVALNNFFLRDVDKIIDNYMFKEVLNNKFIDDKEVEGKDISILENNSLDEYNNPSRTQEINENRGIVDRKLILNYLKSINEINGKEILKEIAEEEVKAKQKIKPKEELENKKLEQQEKEKEVFSRAGITRTALNKILQDNRCKIDQINVRVLGTLQALRYAEELTGANLRRFKRWRYYGS